MEKILILYIHGQVLTLPEGWSVPQKVTKLKTTSKKSNKTATKKTTIKAEAIAPVKNMSGGGGAGSFGGGSGGGGIR